MPQSSFQMCLQINHFTFSPCPQPAVSAAREYYPNGFTCPNKNPVSYSGPSGIASLHDQNKISPLCSASNPRSCIFPFRRLSLRLRSSSSFFFSSNTSATGASRKGGGTISSLSRSYTGVSNWSCVQDYSNMFMNRVTAVPARQKTYNLPKQQNILPSHQIYATRHISIEVSGVKPLDGVL